MCKGLIGAVNKKETDVVSQAVRLILRKISRSWYLYQKYAHVPGRGGVLPMFGRRGCADYMGGFFLGAKYADMSIFWNLYLRV